MCVCARVCVCVCVCLCPRMYMCTLIQPECDDTHITCDCIRNLISMSELHATGQLTGQLTGRHPLCASPPDFLSLTHPAGHDDRFVVMLIMILTEPNKTYTYILRQALQEHLPRMWHFKSTHATHVAHIRIETGTARAPSQYVALQEHPHNTCSTCRRYMSTTH